MRNCPSRTGSQSLPFWSCSINFSLLISMNCLSSDLLALLHHQHILKCNSIVFITSHYICSLRFVYRKLKGGGVEKDGMQAPWIYHSPFGNIPILQNQSQNFAGQDILREQALTTQSSGLLPHNTTSKEILLTFSVVLSLMCLANTPAWIFMFPLDFSISELGVRQLHQAECHRLEWD